MAFLVIVLAGTAMYFIEGETNQVDFGNIPRCCYWAVITMSTVGLVPPGDCQPVPPGGGSDFQSSCTIEGNLRAGDMQTARMSREAPSAAIPFIDEQPPGVIDGRPM